MTSLWRHDRGLQPPSLPYSANDSAFDHRLMALALRPCLGKAFAFALSWFPQPPKASASEGSHHSANSSAPRRAAGCVGQWGKRLSRTLGSQSGVYTQSRPGSSHCGPVNSRTRRIPKGVSSSVEAAPHTASGVYCRLCTPGVPLASCASLGVPLVLSVPVSSCMKWDDDHNKQWLCVKYCPAQIGTI